MGSRIHCGQGLCPAKLTSKENGRILLLQGSESTRNVPSRGFLPETAGNKSKSDNRQLKPKAASANTCTHTNAHTQACTHTATCTCTSGFATYYFQILAQCSKGPGCFRQRAEPRIVSPSGCVPGSSWPAGFEVGEVAH